MVALPTSCTVPIGLKRGSAGPDAKILQEWLTLGGYPVTIDGDFGPATERALRGRFERVQVDARMQYTLVEGMNDALAATGSIVEVARTHLAQHPREVGGPNRGPWCRLYSGDSGEGRPWCGDFVTFVVKQAKVDASGLSPSCDVIASRAKAAGRLSSVPTVGGVFLVRSAPGDWTHTGIVTGAGPGWVTTIEGNTNDQGSREGFEVCARTRGVGKLDFVRLA